MIVNLKICSDQAKIHLPLIDFRVEPELATGVSLAALVILMS